MRTTYVGQPKQTPQGRTTTAKADTTANKSPSKRMAEDLYERFQPHDYYGIPRLTTINTRRPPSGEGTGDKHHLKMDLGTCRTTTLILITAAADQLIRPRTYPRNSARLSRRTSSSTPMDLKKPRIAFNSASAVIGGTNPVTPKAHAIGTRLHPKIWVNIRKTRITCITG